MTTEPTPSRRPIVVVEPAKRIGDMTPQERRALAEALAKLTLARYRERRQQ